MGARGHARALPMDAWDVNVKITKKSIFLGFFFHHAKLSNKMPGLCRRNFAPFYRRPEGMRRCGVFWLIRFCNTVIPGDQVVILRGDY